MTGETRNHSVVWKWAYFRKRFHDSIRSGKKFRTLRTARLGRVGDFIACPVGLIRIEDVTKETPRRVAQVFWESEGCDSPEDFLSEFDAIHPGVDLDKPMLLHRFRLVLEAGR